MASAWAALPMAVANWPVAVARVPSAIALVCCALAAWPIAMPPVAAVCTVAPLPMPMPLAALTTVCGPAATDSAPIASASVAVELAWKYFCGVTVKELSAPVSWRSVTASCACVPSATLVICR